MNPLPMKLELIVNWRNREMNKNPKMNHSPDSLSVQMDIPDCEGMIGDHPHVDERRCFHPK